MNLNLSMIVNLILFPIITIAAGLLASTEITLKTLPQLRKVIYALLPLRFITGISAIASGTALLILPPGESPVIGNFLPATAAILSGLAITPELLLNDHHSRRENLILLWLKQALLKLKAPIGILAVMSGLFHIIAWDKAGF